MSTFIKPIRDSLTEGDLGGINAALMTAQPRLGSMGERVVAFDAYEHDYCDLTKRVIELIKDRAETQGSNTDEAEMIQEQLGNFVKEFSKLEAATNSVETFEIEGENEETPLQMTLKAARALFSSIWG